MEAIFIDTHVLVWLYTDDSAKLSSLAKEIIDDPAVPLLVSPISVLEVDYLYEIGRMSLSGLALCDDLKARVGLQVLEDSFLFIIREAASVTWTRDVFDRLLVAHAILHKAPILTKDKTIRKHYKKGIW